MHPRKSAINPSGTSAASVSDNVCGFLIFSVFLSILQCVSARFVQPEKPVPVIPVEAVMGRRAELTCDVTPLARDDSVYMVFWFRDAVGKPIYSLDVRGKPFSQAKHWSSEEAFGSRAHFRTVATPARLVVEAVELADEGVYRCRVDFRNSPTRSARLNLTIIVPPEEPIIFDSAGREVQSVLGPYNEHVDLILTCEVRGGHPLPSVYWFLNGVLVDGSYESSRSGVSSSVSAVRASSRNSASASDSRSILSSRETAMEVDSVKGVTGGGVPMLGGVVLNRLVVNGVDRKNFRSTFTCRASNTRLAPPVERTVTLDLNLKPLSVKISPKRNPLAADTRYEVECKSSGSHPPAVITWWKGTKQLKKVKMEETGYDNVSISSLSLVPVSSDDTKTLTCRAENPRIPGAALEDTWRLSVVFPPIVSLQMGSTLNPNDIKEGDDVYFECQIRSNPPIHRLTWLLNNVVLTHNVTSGVIMSNQSLVLQGVSRASAGNYTCLAANSEGETASNDVHLRVMYSPVCKNDFIIVIGASKEERLDVVCDVEAVPPEIRFKWKFNNSGESLEVPPTRYSSNGTSSTLAYSPKSDLDYGTLTCWGINSVGAQVTPCIYQVVSAEPPQPLRNCSLLNLTADAVEVECEPGYDGGLPQVFELEMYDARTHKLKFNATSLMPMFTVTELEPGTPLRLVLYAKNAKGRSSAVVLEDVVLQDAEKRTATETGLGFQPLLAVLIGAGVALLSIVVLVVITLRNRSQAAQQGDHHNAKEQKKYLRDVPYEQHCVLSYPLKNGAARDEDGTGGMTDLEERDPDLIPAQYELTSLTLPHRNGDLCQRDWKRGIVGRDDQEGWPGGGTTPERMPLCAGDAALSDDSSRPYTTLPYDFDRYRIKTGHDVSERDLRYQQQYRKSTDITELNGSLIKEQLLSSNVPESCV